MRNILIIALLFAACSKGDDWQDGHFCTCEITLDKDSEYITFYLKGCQYCCWTMTIETADCRVADGNPSTDIWVLSEGRIQELGERFYRETIAEDPVCEWEGVDWEWGFGRPLN